MLKPFQIRDLHRSASQDDLSESQNLDQIVIENRDTLQSRHNGIVRLSSTEYDELATTHPRARLTYIDDDDDELIMVGSSLELFQRLEESVDTQALPRPTLQSVAPEPMHIFDIRRSNSVRDLWKKFEYKSQAEDRQDENEIGTASAAADASWSNAQEESASTRENSGPTTTEDPESLLAAFEAEMIKILGATDSVAHDGNAQPESPAETSTRPESDRRQFPSDAFIHALHNLVEGAEMIGTGVRSRLPEFERQLQNLQHTLPEHVGSSVQVALAALDSQARNLIHALNNASAVGGQRAGILFQSELPTPAATIEGLRNMASELGHMGHTLFEAFESEFRCNASRDQGQRASGDNPGLPVSGLPQPIESAANAPADVSAALPEAQQSSLVTNCENEKEPLGTETRDTPSTHVGSQESPSGQDTMLPSDRNADPSDSLQQQPGSSSPTFHSSPDNQAQCPNLWNKPRPLPHRPHPFSHKFRHPFAIPNTYNPSPAFQVPPLPSMIWQYHGPPPRGPHLPPHLPHPHPHPPPPHSHAHPHGPPHGLHHGTFYSPACVLPTPPQPPRPRHKGWPASQHNQNDSRAPANEAASHSERDSPSTVSSAGTSLFIGNVGFGVHEAMIRDVFASKGFLVDVHLPLDTETGRHAGFGYLHFPSIHAARAALDALQGTHIDGHSINLEISDHSPITTLYTVQGHEEAFHQLPTLPELQSSSIIPAGPMQVSYNLQVTEEQRDSANDRRSSPLTVADLCTNDNRQLSTETPPRDTSLVSSSLLDSERLNTLYPSLLPEGSPPRARVGDNTSTQLPDLSRELEECRFPPVSQLDAHFLAERRGGAESSSNTSIPRTRSTPRTGFVDSHDSLSEDAPQGLPGSFPQDSQDSLQSYPKLSPNTDATEQRAVRTTPSYSRLRPRTMRSFHPSQRHSGPWDTRQAYEAPDTSRSLRRRATERHSLQDGRPMSLTDDFHRSSRSTDAIRRPRTFMAESSAVKQRSIDDCVSALVSLGYGRAEEGGLQRIAVYAAAVDGRVSDAIEMIEEERKAYEQQGSMR
ncbi:hypothetical protein BDV28DRAFT_137991 [Aspergillus coremiiformis]|uniref:RRM domain-containing protein n=1 Tax=Aspergillus coremiiformis TaxID=138285 RepID=A0A5N6Z2U6_9EURO|nr:hypothetical protein BDV28DRAFT_137991 [Aspergillus coremiiformis]